jgi:hypothetical protein
MLGKTFCVFVEPEVSLMCLQETVLNLHIIFLGPILLLSFHLLLGF